MTLKYFLLCGLVPLLVTAIGVAICYADIRKEQRERSAGKVPLPGHIMAMQIAFKLFLPSAIAWLSWLGWGALTWLQAAIDAAVRAPT